MTLGCMGTTRVSREWKEVLRHADEMTLLNWKVELFARADQRKPDRRRPGKFTASEERVLQLVDHRLKTLDFEAREADRMTRGLKVRTLKPGEDPHPEKTFGRQLSPMQRELKHEARKHYWRARYREDQAARYRWATRREQLLKGGKEA